ncbi:hypothetical protein HDZ31DRAFT_62460 [Schizophyllum fasciatum]
MGFSTQTATVLGKRKAYVLRLASSPEPSTAQSESEYEPEQGQGTPAKGTTSAPIIVNGKLVKDTKKRYACTYAGCDKAYTKPSRLEEHVRSHTGQRPFVCATCGKSYLRDTHLQAHSRSHLPESARPLECPVPGCGKRLWTSQHLRVHVDWHNGAKPFQCTEEGCDEAFAKHHQLRTHICTVHCPEGTKPYRCEHAGCTKSFSTNQKLRAHARTHDETRYACLTCTPPASFSNWTALQHHNRTAHPPTCSHPACNGRQFASQKGLRAHQKIHEQQDFERALHGIESDAEEDGDQPPKKRRRGGEVGRDWKCEVEGCGKDFKSKKALTTHTNVTHLGHRDFVCAHQGCGRAFGYKHLLQRHVAKLHSNATASSSSSDDENVDDGSEDEAAQDADERADEAHPEESTQPDASTFIDLITGSTYAKKAQDRLRTATSLSCPYPDLSGLPIAPPATTGSSSSASTSHTCDYVFSRAYDLRRHLRATHGVETDKDALDTWVRKEKRVKAAAI